ncbi:hypothetical protein M427DRAFT_60987 [Gonapodya prolifera JEL478]|uniref:Uncharacterized protein n=1 Tax=Gonapodya prolifera (strain JEL478) TaxID=1344416 RepID=A0A139A3E6_GONPJ|nr:hypothetical protein M427DRAFT_60987 [Gonapodya prolifera JEL478]|eukprot:KXS11189.1 hypothetical protein M427DRAFT_60987 [Gonapodya prolifera JEL478]
MPAADELIISRSSHHLPTGVDAGHSLSRAMSEPEGLIWTALKRSRNRFREARDEAESNPPPSPESTTEMIEMWEEVAGHVTSLHKLRASASTVSTTIPCIDSSTQGESAILSLENDPFDDILDTIHSIAFPMWDAAGWTQYCFPDVGSKQNQPLSEASKSLKKTLRQLRDWTDSGVYSQNDLADAASSLSVDRNILSEIVVSLNARAADTHNDSETRLRLCALQGVAVVEATAENCETLLVPLQLSLTLLHPALIPVHTRLVHLHRDLVRLSKLKDPGSWDLAVVGEIQEELREIDSARIEGKYVDLAGEVISGQALVVDLLERCFDVAHDLLESRDVVVGDSPLREIYEKLIRIRAKLETLFLTHKWSLKETDLTAIQDELRTLDSMRHNNAFPAPQSPATIPPGQAVLHAILHKSYRLVHHLTCHLEAEGESAPSPTSNVTKTFEDRLTKEDPRAKVVRNQVETMRMCLGELRRWRCKMEEREEVPYKLKLEELEALWEGMGNGAGGGVARQISECYRILDELRSGAVAEV